MILQGSPALSFGSYGIDSRLAVPGGLFFAVPGRRDGHDFVADAAKNGAAGAVVARPVAVADPAFGLVQVRDTVAALQAVGHDVLIRRPVKVVGITGSVGKTTTKEFTAALLARRFRVLKSEGNFNNQLGLALIAPPSRTRRRRRRSGDGHERARRDPDTHPHRPARRRRDHQRQPGPPPVLPRPGGDRPGQKGDP